MSVSTNKHNYWMRLLVKIAGEGGVVLRRLAGRNLINSWDLNTFRALLRLFLPLQIVVFFPLVASIRMIDERRCRGDG